MTFAFDRTLVDMLQETVAHRGDGLAIVDDKLRLTYRELQSHVEDLASLLIAHGVRPDDRVGVLLPNCAAFVVANWAIFRAGAIATPIHCKSEPREIAFYLRDSNISTIVIDATSLPTVRSLTQDHRVDAIVIADTDRVRFTTAAAVALPGPLGASARRADDLALTGYSTGTSGLPKRLSRTHRQILHEAAAIVDAMNITSADRIFGVVPLFHAYGWSNVMLCGIAAGATMVLTDGFFVRDAVARIVETQVTGFPALPFMIQLLGESSGDVRNVTSLRYCLSAGSPLTESVATAFQRRFGLPVQNLYGSTETGVIAINGPESSWTHPSAIGWPVGTVELCILDDRGTALGPNVEGSVAVRSPSAASGYDRDVPGDSQFREGWFVPGDLAIRSEAGLLSITGRTRGFINVAGNKVDPEEVARALRSHASVSDAAVFGIPDAETGQAIKAVVVLSRACARSDLFEHVRGLLAPHKRPRLIVVRDSLRRSPLGKLLPLDGPFDTEG
jgi:long-chain acyl-CoA synthetase